MADLGEVGGRVAHVKDGGDRVGGLGLDVEGHASGGHVVGAAMAPGECGPVLHQGGVGLGSMPQREDGQIALQRGDLLRALAEVKLARVRMTRQFIAQGYQGGEKSLGAWALGRGRG